MKKSVLLAMVMLAALSAFAQGSAPLLEAVEGERVARFVTGDLGRIDLADPAASARAFVESRGEMLRLRGTERFVPVGVSRDELGQTHVKLQQELRGLPVVGGEYLVHADPEGRVIAMNGHYAVDRDLPWYPTVDAWAAVELAAAQAGIADARWESNPELLYVVNAKGNAFLAWSAKASWVSAEGEELDIVYANAASGDLVLRAPQIHRARNRATYNGNNSSSLPGTLVLSETGGSTSARGDVL
jgi:vibriolysin